MAASTLANSCVMINALLISWAAMSFNLRQIEVFRAVMITGSIRGASQLLFVSQPAVSRLLSHTEVRVGFPLFERIRGRLFATPEAKKLFHEVEVVYAGVKRVNELARELSEHQEGILNLIASPSVGQAVVPMAMAEYRHSNPQVKLTFQYLGHTPLTERLLDRQADLAMTILPVNHPNLEMEELGSGRLVCICPYNHPLAPRPPPAGPARHALGGRPAAVPADLVRPRLALRRDGGRAVRGQRRDRARRDRGRLAAERLRAGAGGRGHRAGRRVLGPQLGLEQVRGAPGAQLAGAQSHAGAAAHRADVAVGAGIRRRAAGCDGTRGFPGFYAGDLT